MSDTVSAGRGPIFLLTGPPGAGKSTVARALLRRFPFGLHIPVDDLREWVVSGVAHPVPHWTDETTRQFGLARRGAIQLAQLYAADGFAVAIDDIVSARELAGLFAPAFAGYAFYPVLLLPPAAVALRRNRERTSKAFDTAILDGPIANIHRSYVEQRPEQHRWTVIDSGGESAEQTAGRIMALLRS